MSAIIKRCGCGRMYRLEQWKRLQYVGVQGDEVETFELRNCDCGSTIAIPITLPAAPPDKDAAELFLSAWIDACRIQFAARDGRTPWAEACLAWVRTARLAQGDIDRQVFRSSVDRGGKTSYEGSVSDGARTGEEKR